MSGKKSIIFIIKLFLYFYLALIWLEFACDST
jgi:hypothetical protein